MSVIFTNGSIELVSLAFINDLVTEISNLSDTYDEYLAYLSTQQTSSLVLRGARTHHTPMYMVYGHFEDSLINAMAKLRTNEPEVFRRLVEKHPGVEAIANVGGS